MRIPVFLLLMALGGGPLAAQTPPVQPAPLKAMPLPPELDGSFATHYVVPFGLPKVSFLADISTQIDQSVSEGREAYIPYRERIEHRQNGVTTAVVIFGDLLIGYGIDYLHRTYMDLDDRPMIGRYRTDNAYRATWLVARDGEDVDDGLVRTRYRFDKSQPNGDRYVGTMWVAEAYNLVVQGEGDFTSRGATHHVRFKLSNIQVGPQDPALFYPPEGFQHQGTGLSPYGPPRTDYEGVQP